MAPREVIATRSTAGSSRTRSMSLCSRARGAVLDRSVEGIENLAAQPEAGLIMDRPDKFLRMADGQWAQQQGVDDAEDHGIRSDAKRDQQSGDGREARTPAVKPHGITEIGKELAHASQVSALTKTGGCRNRIPRRRSNRPGSVPRWVPRTHSSRPSGRCS